MIDDFKNQLILGDCLEVMPQLPEKSIDMILCDLPYGTTACHWDVVIPFEPLWECYKRVIKPCGAIVLFGSQPFTSLLVASNLKWFRYEWIWDKVATSSGFNASNAPLRCHENILVFSQKQASYFPIKSKGVQWHRGGVRRKAAFWTNGGKKTDKRTSDISDEKFPKSIISFSSAAKTPGQHPTQKPVPLLSYLIRTYTNPGDLVLDNTMGSGSTIIACLETQRNYIGIEKDPEIYAKAVQRIENLQPQLSIFDITTPASA